MHPKEAEVHKRNEEKRKLEEDKRAKLLNWTGIMKLRYVHIRNGTHKGGMTVAFRFPARGTIIEMSTALVHPNDSFCKREGRYHAARSFALGYTVKVRVPNTYTPATFIKDLFEIAV